MLEDRIFSELSPTRARRIAVLAACLAVALGAATLGAALLAASQARAQVPAPSSRGEYLARIMDCGGCHTGGALVGQPDPRLHLAGSAQGFGIPDIGYFYPPNLTPDPETGLGAWSEADIIRAVRQGVRPDGRTLAPLMPWPSYGALTDEDAAALARYLKALPAARRRTQARQLKDPRPMNMQARIRPTPLPTTAAATVREAEAHEAPRCAALVHAAGVTAVRDPDRPAGPGLAEEQVAAFLADGSVRTLVAEIAGQVVGVAFLHEGDRVRSLGPVAVEPELQGRGIGRQLMEAALHRAGPATSVRLLADATEPRAQALAVAMEFLVKEPLLLLHGMPQGLAPREGMVRRLRSTDIPACAALCKAVLGVTRTHELASPGRLRDPMVIERDGRITGYLTAPAHWVANHGVAESPADMRALLAGAAGVVRAPCSLLLPARGNALLAWALEQGLRIVKPMLLLARGPYAQPRGVWFPSGLY